jgi:small subunit ribosomal protein S16
LQKLGRRNRMCFRIVVTDVRVKRQGDYLEKLGEYDPVEKNADKQIVVDAERVRYWVKHGAQPTGAASSVLARKGIKLSAMRASVSKTAAAKA